jgi:hypothetical protein
METDMKHGRIEKQVFTDYDIAKELIEKSDFFGVFIDKEKNILIKLQGIKEDVILINEKHAINKGYGIFGYIDIYEPNEILVFENIKEAIDWLRQA